MTEVEQYDWKEGFGSCVGSEEDLGEVDASYVERRRMLNKYY